MESAIDKLILNNCEFMEDIHPSESYFNLLDENDNIYKKLKEMLNSEQIELLDKLIFNHQSMEADATDRFLMHGFKAGVRLMVECL